MVSEPSILFYRSLGSILMYARISSSYSHHDERS